MKFNFKYFLMFFNNFFDLFALDDTVFFIVNLLHFFSSNFGLQNIGFDLPIILFYTFLNFLFVKHQFFFLIFFEAKLFVLVDGFNFNSNFTDNYSIFDEDYTFDLTKLNFDEDIINSTEPIKGTTIYSNSGYIKSDIFMAASQLSIPFGYMEGEKFGLYIVNHLDLFSKDLFCSTLINSFFEVWPNCLALVYSYYKYAVAVNPDYLFSNTYLQLVGGVVSGYLWGFLSGFLNAMNLNCPYFMQLPLFPLIAESDFWLFSDPNWNISNFSIEPQQYNITWTLTHAQDLLPFEREFYMKNPTILDLIRYQGDILWYRLYFLNPNNSFLLFSDCIYFTANDKKIRGIITVVDTFMHLIIDFVNKNTCTDTMSNEYKLYIFFESFYEMLLGSTYVKVRSNAYRKKPLPFFIKLAKLSIIWQDFLLDIFNEKN